MIHKPFWEGIKERLFWATFHWASLKRKKYLVKFSKNIWNFWQIFVKNIE